MNIIMIGRRSVCRGGFMVSPVAAAVMSRSVHVGRVLKHGGVYNGKKQVYAAFTHGCHTSTQNLCVIGRSLPTIFNGFVVKMVCSMACVPLGCVTIVTRLFTFGMVPPLMALYLPSVPAR